MLSFCPEASLEEQRNPRRIILRNDLHDLIQQLQSLHAVQFYALFLEQFIGGSVGIGSIDG